jgi:hypothetical protein
MQAVSQQRQKTAQQRLRNTKKQLQRAQARLERSKSEQVLVGDDEQQARLVTTFNTINKDGRAAGASASSVMLSFRLGRACLCSSSMMTPSHTRHIVRRDVKHVAQW